MRAASGTRRTGLALLVLAALLASACAATGADDSPRPYDEKADARAAIAAALADNPERKRVLLTFGGNWCSDSRALEAHYRGQLAPLLEREFKVVHIDVGMFHRNLDIVESYGNPIDKGIPSVVLLDPEGKTLFVNHGALSKAEHMSAASVRRFFERLAAEGRAD